MSSFIAWTLGALLLIWPVVVPAASARAVEGSEAFAAQKLAQMDEAIAKAIAEGNCPGGVLWVEHEGAVYRKAYGFQSVVPQKVPTSMDTIYDAASLTKVVACTPAIMLLIERGRVALDSPVSNYLPEFSGDGREAITIRHLLTHTSGLRPGIETRSDWSGQPAAIRKACEEKPQNPPGTVLRYSDINFFVLGEVVQRVTKQPLERFVQKEIYEPLRMVDTGYLPPQARLSRIAPTEVVKGVPFHGVVHDPTSRKMGGVAGHAGLFTTASDLARYARMLLNLGELDRKRIFKPETVKLMTSVQTPAVIVSRRGLGWDIDSGYSGPRGRVFPIGSYGHTGWTGTSLWIDPFSRTFIIFLSNRNHPNEDGSVVGLRATLGTLAAEAVRDFNFAYVPDALPTRLEIAPRGIRAAGARASSKTLNGIDVLARQQFAPLKNLKLGLVTNHTGQDRDRNPTIDLLRAAPGVELKALFSPEHGIRGAVDEKVGDSVDEQTGLPIYSLYGETRKPKPEQLKDLDALVFDIQDIGCRFYTYISTMGLCLEAAAENGKKLIVLDRVDPITGSIVDGPVLADKASFVGFHNIPLRYGMTIGELARMFNEERNCKADLTVVEVQNWRRDLWLDQTELPWTNPSPNMRNLTQATLYPGVGLLESAVSVGRGTDQPFEFVGAPYINDLRLAQELNNSDLPGVRFVPITFTPSASIHKGELCRGVYIILTDRDRCNVVDVGVQMAKTLYRLYPEQFKLDKIRHLLLHPATLQAIKDDVSLAAIRESWKRDLDEFQQRRARFLIYK